MIRRKTKIHGNWSLIGVGNGYRNIYCSSIFIDRKEITRCCNRDIHWRFKNTNEVKTRGTGSRKRTCRACRQISTSCWIKCSNHSKSQIRLVVEIRIGSKRGCSVIPSVTCSGGLRHKSKNCGIYPNSSTSSCSTRMI